MTLQVLLFIGMLGFTISILIFDNQRIDEICNKCVNINLSETYKKGHIGSKTVNDIFGIIACFLPFVYSMRVIKAWKASPEYEKYNSKDDINEYTNKKYIKLLQDYHIIGYNIQGALFAIKYWFCIHYIVYLISILVRLVHIVKKNFSEADELTNIDTIHSALNLSYNFIAFLIPYILGIYLNYLHNLYYKSMLINFRTLERNDEEKDKTNIMRDTLDDDASKEYFHGVMQKRLRKEVDFDFVPSFFGISIPLDNPGYTFAIILSIATVVFNFVTVDKWQVLF